MTSYSIAGNLLLGNQLVPGAVAVIDDRIVDVWRGPREGPSPRLEAAIVAPGLIDLQVNGGFGVEIGDDPAAIRHLSSCLPATGVTSFLPTIISSPPAHYPLVLAAFVAARNSPGARPLGLHIEGPFLSPLRAGAHRRNLIEDANEELFAALLEDDALRLMTLAPEIPGALKRIRRLCERDVVVSLGHTDATYEEFLAGIDAGASMATHLYNAMRGFSHRAPSAVGAALVDDRLTVGLIADGIHSHPASVQLAIRAKGAERIALVSDLMPAAGMPPGQYQLGGNAVVVDGASAELSDGTLAGSIVTLDQAIRNVVRWSVAQPAEGIMMATEVPARLLGLTDRGRLASGCVADLVLFDGDLNVQATIISGQFVFRSPTANLQTLPTPDTL